MGRVLNLIESKKERSEDKSKVFDFNMIRKKKYGVSFEEFEKKLKMWGVKYEIKNPNHIRVRTMNFYLSTGTCYIDGNPTSFRNKGIEFFEEVLRKEMLL